MALSGQQLHGHLVRPEFVQVRLEFLHLTVFDIDAGLRLDVADIHLHDVASLLVDFGVGYGVVLLEILLVLLFSLFLLLDDPLDCFALILGLKGVEAGGGWDGEVELDIDDLVELVHVLLHDCRLDYAVGDAYVLIDLLEWHLNLRPIWIDVMNIWLYATSVTWQHISLIDHIVGALWGASRILNLIVLAWQGLN